MIKQIFILLICNLLSAADRYALIIGNSRYEYLSNLPNAKNDALLMEKKFKELGYETQLLLNATDKQTKKAIKKFADDTLQSELSVIFYAGHGAQVSGQNYILPTDMELPKRESDIEITGININDVIKSMQSSVKVIFLDACRNNPALIKSVASGRGSFRSGLAAVGELNIDKSSGIFIAYATDSDSIASDGEGVNSPFTSALSRFISEPISIDDMFSKVTRLVRSNSNNTQRPYKYASLEGIVSLSTLKSSMPVILDAGLTQEDQDFKELLKKADIESIRKFESKHPTTLYLNEIKQRKVSAILQTYTSPVFSLHSFADSSEKDGTRSTWYGLLPHKTILDDKRMNMTFVGVDVEMMNAKPTATLDELSLMGFETEFNLTSKNPAPIPDRGFWLANDSLGTAKILRLGEVKRKKDEYDFIPNYFPEERSHDLGALSIWGGTVRGIESYYCPPLAKHEIKSLQVEVLWESGEIKDSPNASNYIQIAYYPSLTKNIKDDVVVVVRSINLFPDNNGFFKLARRSPDGFGTISLKEMLFSLSGDVTVLSEHAFSYKDCDWMLIQSGEPDLEESLYKERNNLSRTKFNISRPNDGILSTGDFLGLKYLYKKLFPETSNK